MEWNIIVWCGVYIYIISAIDNIFLRMRVYIYIYVHIHILYMLGMVFRMVSRMVQSRRGNMISIDK